MRGHAYTAGRGFHPTLCGIVFILETCVPLIIIVIVVFILKVLEQARVMD